MFDALAEAGINIEIISTSSIRISCVVGATRSNGPCRSCTSGSTWRAPDTALGGATTRIDPIS